MNIHKFNGFKVSILTALVVMTDMRFFIWTFVLFIFDCFFLRLFLEFYPLVNANGFFIIFACTKI